VFQTTSNKKLEFNIVASVYHLEITPSDVGNYDRVVIQDLLKEVAQTQQVDQSARQKFKVVVINEADHLTRDAQAALRRTMEKYSPNLRLILLANSTSNIIAPIRSRTLLVRVAAPTEIEICEVLRKVGAKEGWKDVEVLNKRIAKESGRNLRRALLMFEAVHAQKYVSLPSSTSHQRSVLTDTAARTSQSLRTFHLLTGKLSSPKSQTRLSRNAAPHVSSKSALSSMTSSPIASTRLPSLKH
jgi:DNA polymerase III delta prime subunit